MKRLMTIALAVCFLAVVGMAGEVKIAWYAPIVHPYFEAVKKGVERFEKQHKVEVLKQIGQEWTQDNENANIEALAAKGYKGFAVYPTDPNAANGLYGELVDNGLAVVNFGCPTAEPTPAAFTVATDIPEAARQATEKLIELMGGQGNIINVLEVLADSNTVARKKTIEEVVAKYPKVKIIQEIGDINSVEDGLVKIQDAISGKINEVNGIICTGYTTTVAATTLLKDINTGDKPKIHFVGIDDDAIVLEAIRKGQIDATLAQNPDGHGYLSCLVLMLMQEGATPRSDNHFFIPAGQVIVTRENVDSYAKDLSDITKKIEDSLTTKYLQK